MATKAAYIDLTEGSAPATPASGDVRIYAKTDGEMYQKDDAGSETGMAGGGGASALDDLSDVDTDKSKTPADGDHLVYDGTDWNAEAAGGGGGGYSELAYVQFTADTAPTATTEGTANAVVSAGSVAFDGSTTVMVEFFAPHISPTGATGAFVVLVLYDGASSIGLLAVIRTNASANDDVKPVHVFRRLTPSNASHTYSVRAYVSGGTGEVIGGAGGSGNYVPGFIRISTVPTPV